MSRKINVTLHKAYRFFHANAGYILGQRAIGAMKLARAERQAACEGISFRWEPDQDTDWSTHAEWCATRSDRVCSHHESLTCFAVVRGRALTNLGGIIDPTPDYVRVVEAELAQEALSELKDERAHASLRFKLDDLDLIIEALTTRADQLASLATQMAPESCRRVVRNCAAQHLQIAEQVLAARKGHP